MLSHFKFETDIVARKAAGKIAVPPYAEYQVEHGPI